MLILINYFTSIQQNWYILFDTKGLFPAELIIN